MSGEGRFSVSFPGIPKKGGQVLNTGVGSLPSFSVTLKTGMAEYLISYMDFPSAFDDKLALKAAYDFGRDETLSANQLVLVSDRDLSVQGHIGRQIIAVGNGQLFNSRIIAVDKRLYQVVVMTRDYRKNRPATIKLFETAISKFLDSFKFVVDAPEIIAQVAEQATATGAVDLGRIENFVYVNHYFGFQVSLPESWSIMERDVTDAAIQVSKETLKGSDSHRNSEIEQSIAKTYLFFSVTKFPLRTPNVTPAMLHCGIERLSGSPVTARVYLENSRDLMLHSTFQYKLLHDVYPETIGGLSFFVMDMQQSDANVILKQKYYATILKGHALFFVTNYFVDADGIDMDKIIHGAKFK